MICTNEKKIYELARIFRSHGMARESGNKTFEKSLIKNFIGHMFGGKHVVLVGTKFNENVFKKKACCCKMKLKRKYIESRITISLVPRVLLHFMG